MNERKPCVTTARDGELSWDDLESFSSHGKSKAKIYPDIVIPSDKPADEMLNVVKVVFTDKNNNSVWRVQYSLPLYEFIDNWLNGFMGIKLDGEI